MEEILIDVCDIKTYPMELITAFDNSRSDEDCYEIIKNYYIKCYHYTRLYDPNKIINEGIKGFSINETLEYIISIYYKLYKNVDECEQIRKAVKEYIKHFNAEVNSKIGKICFIAGMNDETKSYLDYYNMFGGEVTSNATKPFDFHDKLTSIGKNYCIKFKVPVTYLNSKYSGNKIEQLINVMRENYLNRKNKEVDCCIYNINISPNLIIMVDKI